MARPFADLGTLDLVAMLTEHCTHPMAEVIASELDFRVVILAGLAAGAPEVEPIRPKLNNVIHGLGHEQRPPARGAA